MKLFTRGTKTEADLSKLSEDQPDADDDRAFVVACQRGDAEAFSTLVVRHSSKMLNAASRMLGDYDEACDVTQEAFLAAFRSIGSFRAEAKFSTWLYRIVVNTTKNRLLQRHNQVRREEPFPEASLQASHCAFCAASADEFNPARQLEKRELEAQVQKCISALEADFREVLVLRDIQGLSYEEIRNVLKTPEGTVKSRLSRARLAMKDCLKKVMGDE